MHDSSEWTDIRRGDPVDVPAVMSLLDGAVRWLTARGLAGQWGSSPLSGNPRLTTLITEIATAGGLHLAVREERVVGALGMGSAPDYVSPPPEAELYIVLLVTDRDHAGRGLGGRLLTHARRLARSTGVGLIRVDCYAGGRQALVHYYETQGFTPTETFTVPQPGTDWPGQVLAQHLG
ncbi:GNAT family N-acetyltransferase [Actinoplanes sp. NPDC051851]|uniref:GNAT family N-acetyltransferase n=1 Tax=Actinoplanes sp. NPDC051851 TaxID=3154753 RepID=UPI003426519B